MKAPTPNSIGRTFCIVIFTLIIPVRPCQTQKLTETPFTLHENVIFFKATLNGSHELNFMFDSGAGITALNSSVAEELDLLYSGESVISTSGRKIKARSSVGNSLQIGQVNLKDLALEVMYLDHLSEYFKTPVDGIIGYDLFSRFITGIHVDKMVLEIFQSLEGLDPGSWKKTKLYRVDNNKVAMDAGLKARNGSYRNYIMTVDTGAPDQIHLFPNTLEDTTIDLKFTNRRVRGFSADTTITENQRGRLKGILIAGKKWKNVRAVIPVDPVSKAALGTNTTYGFIGQELLLDFNIIYDYKNNWFYLQERN